MQPGKQSTQCPQGSHPLELCLVAFATMQHYVSFVYAKGLSFNQNLLRNQGPFCHFLGVEWLMCVFEYKISKMHHAHILKISLEFLQQKHLNIVIFFKRMKTNLICSNRCEVKSMQFNFNNIFIAA